jgi:hypothetical protein
LSTPFTRRRPEEGDGSRRMRPNTDRGEWRRDWSGLKRGQFARDRQSKCGGWSRATVGHANSQHVCGLSVLITRYRDGTLRNITSKRCPMRCFGSGEALPGSLFRRYSSNTNRHLQLLLYPVLAMQGRCRQFSTASNGLPLPSLCRQKTMRRTVVWSSKDDGLGNKESGTSETCDLSIDSCKNFLSIHAHEHTKSRQFSQHIVD